MPENTRKIMIVAGEMSGDLHAAKLADALRLADPTQEYVFFGAAGPKMRDIGVEPIVRSDGLSIVGLAEIGRALPMFLRASKTLKNAAAARKPDAVILVDFPDFNLKLAKALKKQGMTIIYYISPQLWAWRRYRISTVKKYVDLMLTILPFEKDWYAEHGVDHDHDAHRPDRHVQRLQLAWLDRPVAARAVPAAESVRRADVLRR